MKGLFKKHQNRIKCDFQQIYCTENSNIFADTEKMRKFAARFGVTPEGTTSGRGEKGTG